MDDIRENLGVPVGTVRANEPVHSSMKLVMRDGIRTACGDHRLHQRPIPAFYTAPFGHFAFSVYLFSVYLFFLL